MEDQTNATMEEQINAKDGENYVLDINDNLNTPAATDKSRRCSGRDVLISSIFIAVLLVIFLIGWGICQ
jgi:hypothetical protein